MSVPIEIPSTKNSTEATEPSSVAVAVIPTEDPVRKVELFVGAVIETAGGGFDTTLIVIADEVACPPLLSVALAVIECVPAPAAVQVAA